MASYAQIQLFGELFKQFKDTTCSITGGISNFIYEDLIKVRSIVIDTDRCRKTTLVIYKLIDSYYNDSDKTYKLEETVNGLKYKPHYGQYMIPDIKLGDIYITVTSKKITISTWYTKNNKTKDILRYIEKLYNQTFGQAKFVLYYLINENRRWAFTVSRPLKLDITINETIQDLIHYMDYRYYTKECLRTGVLLHGPSNTGKSTMVEYFASRYRLDVYLVNFSRKNLADADLIELFMLVTPNSMIVFEEMDSQLSKIDNNLNSGITSGGILTALDGPQRLSHNVFVMINTNNINNLLKHFTNNALIRDGRIDKVFEFNEVYTTPF